MEASKAEQLPAGAGWLFEPKWDGFRALVFRSGHEVVIQSKAGQRLDRYFPELVAALASTRLSSFVLDGEIVILADGEPSFDDLLLRIHPAASRIAKLAKATPAIFRVFDLLYDGSGRGKLLTGEALDERRSRLVKLFERNAVKHTLIQLSPATTDRDLAQQWLDQRGPKGLDGVMAKRRGETYCSGERRAMIKVKRLRTADCVVGGFRYASTTRGVGSLLLGLYEGKGGVLDYVGHTSSFKEGERKELTKILEPLRGHSAFTGRAPGGPSRWSTHRSTEWEPVEPTLVCEVRFDHFSQGRFRHGTRFLRWRPEKRPQSCTIDQVDPDRNDAHVS